MRRRHLLAVVAVALGSAALTPGAASAATLTADYQLQDGLSSSVPGAPDMTLVGPGQQFVTETVGCKPARVLSFPKGSGLEAFTAFVPGGAPINQYSIVVLFRVSETSSYRRIMVPGGNVTPTYTTDNGLYIHNGRLSWYDSGNMPAPGVVFANDTYAEVAFTHSDAAGIQAMTGYVNGIQQRTWPTNSGTLSGYASGMRFFKDNDGGPEDSAGAVARIRVFNGTLTPAEVAAFHAAGPIAGACDPKKRAQAAVNGKVKAKKKGRRVVVQTGIEASCPPTGGACDGSAAVTRGGGSTRLASVSKLPKALGKKSLSVAAGRTEAVTVKLTKKASKALIKKGKARVTISVKLSSDSGPAAVASRTAKLKLKKPQG